MVKNLFFVWKFTFHFILLLGELLDFFIKPTSTPEASAVKSRLKNETVLKFMERRKCQQFHLASAPPTLPSWKLRRMLSCYLLKRLHFFLFGKASAFQFDFYEDFSFFCSFFVCREQIRAAVWATHSTDSTPSECKKENLWAEKRTKSFKSIFYNAGRDFIRFSSRVWRLTPSPAPAWHCNKVNQFIDVVLTFVGRKSSCCFLLFSLPDRNHWLEFQAAIRPHRTNIAFQMSRKTIDDGWSAHLRMMVEESSSIDFFLAGIKKSAFVSIGGPSTDGEKKLSRRKQIEFSSGKCSLVERLTQEPMETRFWELLETSRALVLLNLWSGFDDELLEKPEDSIDLEIIYFPKAKSSAQYYSELPLPSIAPSTSPTNGFVWKTVPESKFN